MSKYYYKKNQKDLKKIFKYLSVGFFLTGLSISLYIFLPLISWQIFFSPVFASGNINTPIPQAFVLDKNTIKNLLDQASKQGTIDYSNAENWFPSFKGKKNNPKISSYFFSIPKLGIENAIVSTVNNNLDKSLVNYQGTAIPPDKGTAVIYGHSTLPALFNPKNYKAIFATLHTIKIGDDILVTIDNVVYKYKIFNITIVDSSDTSIFTQKYDDSYLTLVTCTPPGTTWKRLIVKAKLEKM